MTRGKAEKVRELLGQIEECEELLRKNEGPLRAFFDEINIVYGSLSISQSQSLIIPNDLLKDYVRQYVAYWEKELAKLKDQLGAL